jgi:predicted Zn finger-like uncharacterized protein
VYTQCSKCETVFKLSAEVLRAAGGQVRCGRCGEVFNALARLAEDSTVFETGESPLDLEARADSILESVTPLQVAQAVAKEYEDFAPPGVEIAHLEVLDLAEEDQAQHQDTGVLDSDVADADRSMEFTLPPGELDRIFVESKRRAPFAVPPLEPQPVPQAPPGEVGVEPQRDPPPHLDPHPESAAVNAPPTVHRVSGFEVPDDVVADGLAGFERELESVDALRNAGRRGAQRRPLILWLSAAIVSSLLLMAQIVHQNREWFVTHAHGSFGTAVRALYGAMGTPLPGPASLSAYQLRQWGVTGDPDANGKLRVRASILNAAAQLQPYPLLRVTLADRFGKGIGRRDFEPAEYLGKPTARLLDPGEIVDATLEIMDPGKNAEGFEIDVCLRGVDQRISCANDAAAPTKR